LQYFYTLTVSVYSRSAHDVKPEAMDDYIGAVYDLGVYRSDSATQIGAFSKDCWGCRESRQTRRELEDAYRGFGSSWCVHDMPAV
jgi:hypothetical protein